MTGLDCCDLAIRAAAERLEELAAIFEVRGHKRLADEVAADALKLYGDVRSWNPERYGIASDATARVQALNRIAERIGQR